MIRYFGTVLSVGSMLACASIGGLTHASDSALALKTTAPATIPMIVDPIPMETKAPPIPPVPPPVKKSFGKRVADLIRGSKKEEPVVVIPLAPDVQKSAMDAPGGADIREIEGGTVALRYEAGRLKAEVSLRVKGQSEPLVLRAEADYSRGKVSNVVGHVQYPKPTQPTAPVDAVGFWAKPNRAEAPSKIPRLAPTD